MDIHIDNSLGNQDCIGLEGVDKKIRIKSMAQGLANAIMDVFVSNPSEFDRVFKTKNEKVCKKVLPQLIDKAVALEKYELAERFKKYYEEAEK